MLNHYCSGVNKHQQATKTKAALNLTMKANVTSPVSPQTEPVSYLHMPTRHSTDNPKANSNSKYLKQTL